MFDLGTHTAGNGAAFGDLSEADGSGTMSICCYYETVGATGSTRDVCGKHNGTNGWRIDMRVGTSVWRLRIGATVLASNTQLNNTQQYALGCIYDGSTVDFYLDAVADGTPAHSTDPVAHTDPVSAGFNGAGGSSNLSGYVGQLAVWNATDIGSSGMTDFDAKSTLPLGGLTFWVRGETESDNALYPSTATYTEVGTITMHADTAVDEAFPQGGSDPMFFLIGCHWGPLILAAKEFGANLFCQPEGEIRRMWSHTQKVIGCALPDYQMWEVKHMWDAAYRVNGRRASFG